MNAITMNPTDIQHIEAEALEDIKIKPMPTEFWKQFSDNELRFFMWKHACYTLPTTELIDFLRSEIVGKAVEICAGNGFLGRALEIPITDRMLQRQYEIIEHYAKMGQPTILYPNDVEELTAYVAIKKYIPDTVIGSFVTQKWVEGNKNGSIYGVEEHKHILPYAKYIHVGNLNVHGDKVIYGKRYKHTKIMNPDFLITRTGEQSKNFISIHQKQ